MNFGTNHYVPVLKIKPAEKAALLAVRPLHRLKIIPLLEFVKFDAKKSIDEHLELGFKGLSNSLESYVSCYLDVRELAPLGTVIAEKVFKRAASEGISFIPVTGIDRNIDVTAAMKYRDFGTCLRISRKALQAGSLSAKIERFLKDNDLKADSVDIIMDLGPVDTMLYEGIELLALDFLSSIPKIDEWRNFIFSACAFPGSMGVVKTANTSAIIERLEWQVWKAIVSERSTKKLRMPTFSDCAIQHTKGVEGIDFTKVKPSPSIRYAIADKWLLIKGETSKNTRPSIQYPKLARALVRSKYYLGEAHCEGCKSITQAVGGASGLGSPGVWRRLGTIHHITTTMQELARLP